MAERRRAELGKGGFASHDFGHAHGHDGDALAVTRGFVGDRNGRFCVENRNDVGNDGERFAIGAGDQIFVLEVDHAKAGVAVARNFCAAEGEAPAGLTVDTNDLAFEDAPCDAMAGPGHEGGKRLERVLLFFA